MVLEMPSIKIKILWRMKNMRDKYLLGMKVKRLRLSNEPCKEKYMLLLRERYYALCEVYARAFSHSMMELQ